MELYDKALNIYKGAIEAIITYKEALENIDTVLDILCDEIYKYPKDSYEWKLLNDGINRLREVPNFKPYDAWDGI